MFNTHFAAPYLQLAPLPLVLERLQECQLFSQYNLQQPILDIGCGDGIFASILFKEKIDVGIDPQAKELACAEKTGSYRELIQCYGDAIPKPDKSFKTIISNSVMEHIPDLQSVLKEAHRLLTDDGQLFLTLPTDLFERYTPTNSILEMLGLSKLSKKYRQFFNKFWRHYHYYSPENWQKLFIETGFEVECIQEYGTKRQCLFNNMMVVWSLPSFFSKKIFNRWFWFPKWRKRYYHLLKLFFFQNELKGSLNTGGLIFFILRKNTAS